MRGNHIRRTDVQDPRPTSRRPDQTQQQPDRGRLTGTVRAEKPEHLTGLDTQVETINGEQTTEPLGQVFGT
jgi:hypothetical protein